MDPHVGNDPNTSTALLLAFDGLLNVKNGAIEPGIAETYEISEDGTVYTFHLRDAKWADGKPVTASDYADTWKRMLTRKDAMDLAYLIFPSRMPTDQCRRDGCFELGVNVIDEKTSKSPSKRLSLHGVAVCSSPMYPSAWTW
jgi:ABC-type oligopeptide transport system substrate-binding subunit